MPGVQSDEGSVARVLREPDERRAHLRHARGPTPAWKDNILFSDSFQGDNGARLGASHQTDWAGIVADMIRRGGGADIPSLAELMAGAGGDADS